AGAFGASCGSAGADTVGSGSGAATSRWAGAPGSSGEGATERGNRVEAVVATRGRTIADGGQGVRTVPVTIQRSERKRRYRPSQRSPIQTANAAHSQISPAPETTATASSPP